MEPGTTAILGTTAATTIFATYLSGVSIQKYWYDWYHKYYSFGPEYTDRIDQILSNPQNAKIGPAIIISPNNHIPGMGVHKYYAEHGYLGLYSVGLEKVRDETTKQIHYIAWISPARWGGQSLQIFENRIASVETDTIRVISIDTAEVVPQLSMLTRICRPARPHQQVVLDHIVANWNSANNHNHKIMIYGKRGSGKTYTGMLVKRQIEQRYPTMSVRLYNDFDPTSVGVNIDTMALKFASARTPVVIVINEVDRVYENVVEDKQAFDPRLQHSRNKQTFNNMLDALAGTPYVIVIFTTEITRDALHENTEYLSFMRRGRIDYFAHMTDSSCTITPNL